MSSVNLQPGALGYPIDTESGSDSQGSLNSTHSQAESGVSGPSQGVDDESTSVLLSFPSSPAEPNDPLPNTGPLRRPDPKNTAKTSQSGPGSGTQEKHPLKVGVFSGHWNGGTDPAGKKQNSVDLHVTGKLGQSIDKQDLLVYLKTAHALIQSHHEETGTPGELEWHPTGAVVTKGAVQLLSETLGGQTLSGSLNKATARMNVLWRKNISSPGQQSRNKMADRIDKDIQPEYFSYLNALKGVKGVSITPITKSREKVAGFDQLSEEDQAKVFDQNMLENSDWGNQRFKQYVDEYKGDPDFVPSLRIKIDQENIPALISTLEKQGK